MFEEFQSPGYGKLSLMYMYTKYPDSFPLSTIIFRLNQWLVYQTL